MKFTGALIKEQGITFAVIIVKKTIIVNRIQSNKAIQDFQPLFPGIPIVLMAQDHRGKPKYYGRRDIVRFLAGIPYQAIPWKEYTLR